MKVFEFPALPDAKSDLVKEGTILQILFYALQHDPKYFLEPDKFQSERFLDEGDQFFYDPFGLGPRISVIGLHYWRGGFCSFIFWLVVS